MPDPTFFAPPKPLPLAELAELIGARLVGDGERVISGVAPLAEAGPTDLSFVENPRYLTDLAQTRAAAVLCAAKYMTRVPSGIAVLEAREPYRAFAKAIGVFYPEALKLPGPVHGTGISPAAHVDPAALLEAGVTVEPGAVIGAEARIGAGTVIAAGAVVGSRVTIGRDCHIGAKVVLQHTLIGNRVIIHPGVSIGQDGFGFAMGPGGHLKVPQIGRVVIQDDVEIGANSTIDRGSIRDTVVGEGTKIDNQVQIGHNVQIGRHCVIVAQAGVSGSTILEDYVVLAGKVGLAGHLRIGMGAQVAGGSNVADDIPAGEKWVGTPAKPIRAWMKELMALTALGRERRSGN